MKAWHILISFVPFVLGSFLDAQTVYIPSGTSGIGSSSNGNVGIGTASPLGTFDIHKVGGSSLVMSSATANVSYTTTLVDDGTNYYTAIGEGSAANSPITFYNPASASPVAQIQVRNLGGNWNSLVIGHNDTYGKLQTTSSTPLALQPTGGNVGIGTTAPGAKLHLATNSSIIDEALRLDNSGNAADNGSKITWYNAAQSHPGAFFGATRVGSSLGIAQIFGTSANWTTTDASERMRIDPSGNVGIGTVSPSQKLDVQGGNIAIGSSQIIGSGLGYGCPTCAQAGTIKLYDGATGYTTIQSGPSYGLLLNPGGGNVGIGTTNPTQKLSVNGTIQAKEVVVQSGWSDYVFEDSYKLPALSEVESRIKAEHHLPGIPSAQEVAEHGIRMGDMQAKLLEKIEELTLRQIAQEKQLAAQAARIDQLEADNATLRNH